MSETLDNELVNTQCLTKVQNCTHVKSHKANFGEVERKNYLNISVENKGIKYFL
ncbi:hypothetical protein CBE01nite_29880 [Clostridium beijerinckii]|nr:hypothetical protein CBE01nite_29880 [Clostridium beijerinckii]